MGIGESISNAANLVVKVRDAKLQAEIQAALIAAQSEALTLQQRVADLQAESEKLKAELRTRDETTGIADDLFYARHAYWRRSETIRSAYCSNCWDTSRKTVRLEASGTYGECPCCGKSFSHVYDGKRAIESDAATPNEPRSSERLYDYNSDPYFGT